MAQEAEELVDDEVLDQDIENDDDTELESTASDEQSGGDGGEADEAPAFSPRALELAGQTGLDPHDYKDEASFLRGVANYDRALREIQRQSMGQPKGDEQSAQEKAQQAQERAALKRWEMKLKNDGAGAIDDEIVNSFKSLDEHYHPQLEALYKEIDQLKSANKEYAEFRQAVEQQRQQEAQERLIDEWDQFFAAVPDGYQAKLGKGGLQELLNGHGTHFINQRNEIVQLGELLRQRDVESGRRPLSRKEYGQRALHAVLGQETIATARKEILNKVKSRNNGAALAGTNGKAQTKERLKGDGKAWETFKKKGKELGLKIDDDEDE